MSNITIAGNAAGTATFTLEAPATNTNRTLTMPDESGTLVTVASVESLVLLGTLVATGSSQSLTEQTLTGYKQLLFDFSGVSGSTAAASLFIGAGQIYAANVAAADVINGTVRVSLWSGVAVPTLTKAALPASLSGLVAQTGYSPATTTITVSLSVGVFDVGFIRVYGVK